MNKKFSTADVIAEIRAGEEMPGTKVDTKKFLAELRLSKPEGTLTQPENQMKFDEYGNIIP